MLCLLVEFTARGQCSSSPPLSALLAGKQPSQMTPKFDRVQRTEYKSPQLLNSGDSVHAETVEEADIPEQWLGGPSI